MNILYATIITSLLMYLHYTFYIFEGLGNSFTYMSAVVAVQDFFDKRRGFATAVSFCGVSLSIFVTSPLLQFLIDHYGWRGTLVIHSALMAHGLPAALMLRTPEQCNARAKSITIAENIQMLKTVTATATEPVKKGEKTNICKSIANMFDFSLLKNVHFTLFLLVTFTFEIGLNVPAVFQIPRAVSFGTSKQVASLLASSFGIGNAVGRIPIGMLSDRVDRRILCGVLNCLSGLITLTVSFLHTFPFAVTHAVILGGLSGMF